MWQASTRHEDEAAAAALLRSALLLGCTGALLWTSWRSVQHTHRVRRQARSPAVPEPLQTWEGEGGRPTTPGQPGLAAG